MLAFNKTCLLRTVLTLQIQDKTAWADFAFICKSNFVNGSNPTEFNRISPMPRDPCVFSYMPTNHFPIQFKETKDKPSQISSK